MLQKLKISLFSILIFLLPASKNFAADTIYYHISNESTYPLAVWFSIHTEDGSAVENGFQAFAVNHVADFAWKKYPVKTIFKIESAYHSDDVYLPNQCVLPQDATTIHLKRDKIINNKQLINCQYS